MGCPDFGETHLEHWSVPQKTGECHGLGAGGSSTYNQPEVERTWGIYGLCQGSFTVHILSTVDSKKLEHGFRMNCAGVPSSFGLG